jgi:hypothetical protein
MKVEIRLVRGGKVYRSWRLDRDKTWRRGASTVGRVEATKQLFAVTQNTKDGIKVDSGVFQLAQNGSKNGFCFISSNHSVLVMLS